MPAGAEPVAMRYAKWAVALAVRERLLVVEHPDTLISRHSLAGAYQAAARLGEAVALYERTLADLERLLGAEHPRPWSRDSFAAARRLLCGRSSAGGGSQD
jgi:hypothetical protein